MKKQIFIGALALLSIALLAFDIPQSQVPSVIVNSFQKTFAKPTGVEWEQKGNWYKVEFEMGLWGVDHEAWYDQNGKIIKHKEDISKNDLPQAVWTVLRANYSQYSIDDISKTTEENNVTYKMELKSGQEEWEIIMDVNGKELRKIVD